MLSAWRALFILWISLAGTNAMAGTNARALRRPKVHRHYHEAAGTLSKVRHIPSLEEALSIAREYKKRKSVRPAKIEVNGPKSQAFLHDFEACLGASSMHGPAWDECEVELSQRGFQEADEAGGGMQ